MGDIWQTTNQYASCTFEASQKDPLGQELNYTGRQAQRGKKRRGEWKRLAGKEIIGAGEGKLYSYKCGSWSAAVSGKAGQLIVPGRDGESAERKIELAGAEMTPGQSANMPYNFFLFFFAEIQKTRQN